MKRNTKNVSLNGMGTNLTSRVGNRIWGNDNLDKRNNTSYQNISGAINAYTSIVDTISNALGNRSPYYVIGEIPEKGDFTTYAEKYGGSLGGAVRAITKVFYGPAQEGVIIDCLGDVDGESSVDFTQNPIMYVSNGVTDSRMRKPATVSAVVCVSNYLSDSIIESVVENTASAIDPTGGQLSKMATNALFYGGNTRAQYALYRLRWLMENGNPFTVYTPHGIYENMLIKSIKPRTDDKKMDMLYAEIEFQEVIMYATYKQTLDGTETAKMPARSAIEQGSSSAGGIKSTTKSIYNNISNWIGGKK